MRAAVFLNGSPDPPDGLRRVAGRADLVIAADGGAIHALAAGIVPDLVVGDMDSLGDEGTRQAESRGAQVLWRNHYWKVFNGFCGALVDPWGNTFVLWVKGGDDQGQAVV